MPSLSALWKFKTSLDEIGGQGANLAAAGIPFNDMVLPETEPEPMPDLSQREPKESKGNKENGEDLDTDTTGVAAPEDTAGPTDTEAGESPPPSYTDFDFSAFTGAPPADIPADPESGTPDLTEPPPPEPQDGVSDEEDIDFDIPDGFNLTDESPSEMESPGTQTGAAADDFGLDALDSLDNLDLPAMPDEETFASPDSEPAAIPDTESPAKPESPAEAAADDFDLGDLGSLDDLIPSDETPDETPANTESGETPAEAAADDFDLGDLGSLDNLDLPDETPDETPADTESQPAAEAAADDFDLGDLGSLDDLDLPDETPDETPADTESQPAAETASDDFDLGGLDDLDLPEETPTDTENQPAAETASDDFDLGDLGDLGDLDLPDESLGEPAAQPTEEAAADDFDLGDLGDLDLPDESLGEPATLPHAPIYPASPDESPSEPEDQPAAEAAADDFDLGGMDDLIPPEETPGETPADTESQPAAETASDDFDLGDLGGLDDLIPPEETPGDEPAAMPTADTESGETPAEAATDDFDLGDLGGLDDLSPPDETFGSPDGEPAAEDTQAPDLSGLEEFDAPLDTTPTEEGGITDLFDNFDPTKKTAQSGKKPSKASDDSDGFDFPDLDNVMGGPSAARRTEAVPSGKAKGRGWTNPNASLEELEDIQLTDTELDTLQQTLSGYPLNLRLACEEIIAEQVVNPVQMAQLLRLLVRGAHPRATASLAGDILGRSITVPKSFEKKTGAALEAEQGTFAYIFVHNFLPVLRLFLFIAVVAGCLFFLIYTFIYKPLKADSIYKLGIERITDGEYQRANERFNEASKIHRKKVWYYRYAEAFRDARQYVYAEEKYDELLRLYPRDKKGVLDYAHLETYYLRNYDKADRLLHRQLLDYNPDDYDGLLAAGDNSLAWGEIEPEKYEDARFSYARLLEKYGWTPSVVERMMLYFIRTDNLKEVLPLRRWFEANQKKRHLSPETTAELGGYLLDKQLEEPEGVPNEYVPYIESVRAMLLKAVGEKPSLPEAHYHLARYYHTFGNRHEERVTLETAIKAFEVAREESVRRIIYHIDTLRRLADVLINDREFLPAEEQLIKAINLYQDALSRFRDPRSREAIARYQFGSLYASLGDLEYFVKWGDTEPGDMAAAVRYYRQAEDNGWAPPEMLYRLGAAYYQLENWKDAQEKIFAASKTLPLNDRILFALGNVSFKRGDYFAAQGYYTRLLGRLESRRSRLPMLLPNDRPEYVELAERLLMAQNNAGAAYEMLSAQTGDQGYRNQAMALYSRSEMSYDSYSRDPRSMIRSGSTPQPFINMRNMLRPEADYVPQIFIRIDRDVVEPSVWEELAPVKQERINNN